VESARDAVLHETKKQSPAGEAGKREKQEKEASESTSAEQVDASSSARGGTRRVGDRGSRRFCSMICIKSIHFPLEVQGRMRREVRGPQRSRSAHLSIWDGRR
jgi:hypothetical protein